MGSKKRLGGRAVSRSCTSRRADTTPRSKSAFFVGCDVAFSNRGTFSVCRDPLPGYRTVAVLASADGPNPAPGPIHRQMVSPDEPSVVKDKLQDAARR